MGHIILSGKDLAEMTTDMWASILEQDELSLLRRMCRIPAPSLHEEKRAEAVAKWLTDHNVSCAIDTAGNVRAAFGSGDPVQVINAHMDVVFPDTDELPLREDEEKIYAPGVGDDTANLCVLMLAAMVARREQWVPRKGTVLLVFGTGEEGLGNLKGTREIMKEYGSRVESWIALDGGLAAMVDTAVGSHRYKITVRTEGGHSYGNFGRSNAIAKLAEIISELYQTKLPREGYTTYNVGIINGGTSINTIAQEAYMLYEYRSERADNLSYMEQNLKKVLTAAAPHGEDITCERIGERPGQGNVNPLALDQLARRCIARMKQYNGGVEPSRGSGSTDCNIPLSMGIPAVCFGCYRGKGAHTREEYVETASLLPGLRLGLKIVEDAFTRIWEDEE